MGSAFSAASSMVGYLYQIRLSLLWALRRLKTSPDFEVSVEVLDDVAFESKSSAIELLQAKHHVRGTANLTDQCVDLWKSLRIWCEGSVDGTIPPEAHLYLVTTSAAPIGSAAYKLRQDNRDVLAATANLVSAATSSTNQANAQGYKAFLALAPDARTRVVGRVTVIDNSSTIADVTNDIEKEIIWAAPRSQSGIFVEYLEGWWFGRVIGQLTGIESSSRIMGGEIEAEIDDLREKFKRDSLPISADLLNYLGDEELYASYLGFSFVKQMELAQASKRRIALAIEDFYRAGEQRSRWLRQELLLIPDLATYERRLVREWELVFEAACDEIGVDAAEDMKLAAARKVIKWAESMSIPIRPAVTEPFVSRGSLHILADQIRIGWHREFKVRLKKALEGNAS